MSDPYRYCACVSWAWRVQGSKEAESAKMAGQVLPASLLDKGLPAGEWVLIPVQAVLSAEMARPKGVSKATVQRCVAALSEHWTPQQYDEVVEMFQTHGLL